VRRGGDGAFATLFAAFGITYRYAMWIQRPPTRMYWRRGWAAWGVVFPLGMYTACTFRLAQVLRLDSLMYVPRVFVYVALVAWVVTFLGWVSVVTAKAIRARD
jgi:tellurite resistance protein TehA-like permease